MIGTFFIWIGAVAIAAAITFVFVFVMRATWTWLERSDAQRWIGYLRWLRTEWRDL